MNLLMLDGLDGVGNALYDLPNDLSNGRPLLTTKQRMFIMVESVIAFPYLSIKNAPVYHKLIHVNHTMRLYLL